MEAARRVPGDDARFLVAGACRRGAGIDDAFTESELREEVRVTAFLNAEPARFIGSVLREAGERMVDQIMIRNENVTSRFGSATEQETDAMIAQLIRDRFKGNRAAYLEALASYRLTEEVLRAHVQWQLTAMRYISVRFTTGVQVTDAQVEAYFRTQIQPQLPEGSEAKVEDYRERIQEALIQQRANEDADAWVKETRRRIVIDFHPEVFP